MAIPAFNPKTLSGYGSSGQESAQKMYDSLSGHTFGLTYDSSSKIFTVLRSAGTKKEEIEKIFNSREYDVWAPQVLGKVDADENHLVRLVSVAKDPSTDRHSIARLTFPFVDRDRTRDDRAAQPTSGLSSIGVSFRGTTCIDIGCRSEKNSLAMQTAGAKVIRDNTRYNTALDTALELIYDLSSIGVSFRGTTCIDIGCRSGENSLAMQAAGAKVIGIDPDDQEFAVALSKGIDKSQLVKASLQDYHKAFPDAKFDIATVFLWNISCAERESFVSALQTIIKPGGLVIIGYVDELYDKDPDINVPALMRTGFSKVKRFVFEKSLNRYLLLCSAPEI